MRQRRIVRTIMVGVPLVVVVPASCGGTTTSGTSTGATESTSASGARASTPASSSGPATVAPSQGDGSTPKILAFEIEPADNAPCQDGKARATMSWKVSPSTATVTITDLGYGFGDDTSTNQTLGPFAAEVEAMPVPDWVKCNGKDYNLSLLATNGGPKSSGLTAHVNAVAER